MPLGIEIVHIVDMDPMLVGLMYEYHLWGVALCCLLWYYTRTVLQGKTSKGRTKRAVSGKKQDSVYADYAGCPPCSKELLEDSYKVLMKCGSRLRNPHSEVDVIPQTSSAILGDRAAINSSTMIESLRRETLKYCSADREEYVCILTHGATSGCQLIAESFPWGDEGHFLYLQDNHTSVVGIQGGLAPENGSRNPTVNGRVQSVAVQRFMQLSDSLTCKESICLGGMRTDGPVRNLFAFPLESNFSGARYSLECVSAIQNGSFFCDLAGTECPRSRVLVDAAKASSTYPPDLSKFKPDFVVLSYYKIFGHPTGLGAMIVRRDALAELKPRYFGGGTVDFLVPEVEIYDFKGGVTRFERGTLPYMSVPPALVGFSWLQRSYGPPETIGRSAMSVASTLVSALQKLKHENGNPRCRVYGRWDEFVDGAEKDGHCPELSSCIQGPTVTFNVFDAHGRAYGCREVERMASLYGISIRSGTLCNAGALQHALGISPRDMARWKDHGFSCGGTIDAIPGVPTGAIRVSFGFGSRTSDAEYIGRFVRETFCETSKAICSMTPTTIVAIERIVIYPIKSCQGQVVDEWILDASGLKYDRHWKIVDSDMKTLTLKSCPELSQIYPIVDAQNQTLSISSTKMNESVTIELKTSQSDFKAANAWLTSALGTPCMLVDSGEIGSLKNFSNHSNVLIVYNPSIQHIHSISNTAEAYPAFVSRMRPNIIVTQMPKDVSVMPFEDDEWTSLSLINSDRLLRAIRVKPCTRCDMICVDPVNGRMSQDREPLRSILNAKKGCSKQLSLGSLYSFCDDTITQTVRVGMKFHVEKTPINEPL